MTERNEGNGRLIEKFESETDDVNPIGCRAYETPLDTLLKKIWKFEIWFTEKSLLSQTTPLISLGLVGPWKFFKTLESCDV